MTIEVVWRSGMVSVVRDVRPNWIYEVDEAGASGAKTNPKAEGKPFFSDASQLINHTHFDDAFNDFERQPLIPRRLSQLGPGVSWYDVDGDGWDDLMVGGGVGGFLAV